MSGSRTISDIHRLSMTAPSKARQTLDALVAQQEALLARIERTADAGKRVWQEHPHTWSLAQVFQHLAMSAHGLLRTERPRRKRVGQAKFLVMRAVLKSPVRLTLPPGVPIIPAPAVSWEEAVRNARAGLQAWSAYLAREARDVVFMHPRVGALTTEQSVTFLRDHFDHHVMQVERLLRRVAD